MVLVGGRDIVSIGVAEAYRLALERVEPTPAPTVIQR
jgi:hypothetical protein